VKKSIFKESLWFIIPTLILAFLLCIIIYVFPSPSKFITYQQYLRLSLNDELFIKMFFTTRIIPAIISIIFGLLLYIVKNLINKKMNYKLSNPLFYTLLFTTYTFYGTYVLIKSAGYQPNQLLSVGTFVTVLISIQIGIFVCFIIWLIDKLFCYIKFKRSPKKMGT